MGPGEIKRGPTRYFFENFRLMYDITTTTPRGTIRMLATGCLSLQRDDFNYAQVN